MNRDKQMKPKEIKELVDLLVDYGRTQNDAIQGCEDVITEIIITNGYRKASDVAREIFAEIDNILSVKIDATKKNERRAEYLAHNDMASLYSTIVGVFEKLQEEFAELKKKYESEGEG